MDQVSNMSQYLSEPRLDANLANSQSILFITGILQYFQERVSQKTSGTDIKCKGMRRAGHTKHSSCPAVPKVLGSSPSTTIT